MVGCIEQTNHNPGLFNFSYESIIIMIVLFWYKENKDLCQLVAEVRENAVSY